MTNERYRRWCIKLRQLVARLKELEGDPHHIAMGMAIGVFISVTPTIPFHTILAVAMAFVLRGSKIAAAIGVWFSNPVTVPFFYLGSYKVGTILLCRSSTFNPEYESITELLNLGIVVTGAMIVGGAILGFLPGVAVYFITRRVVTAVRSRDKTAYKNAK